MDGSGQANGEKRADEWLGNGLLALLEALMADVVYDTKAFTGGHC
jgi:hypothetical protein